MSDYDPITNRRRSRRLRAEPMERFVELLSDPRFFDELIAPHLGIVRIIQVMHILPQLWENPQNRRLEAMNTPISQMRD
jgi:hypothetical protein